MRAGAGRPVRPPRGAWVAMGVPMALGLLVVAVSAGLPDAQEQPFPHAAHEGLFPVCTGCHEAPAPGERPGYPDPGLCAQCHEGGTLPLVTWTGPADVPSNVAFDHAAHAFDMEASGASAQSCESCHSPAEGGRMALEDRVREEGCFSCHVSGPDGHFSAGPQGTTACAFCHVPLAGSRMPVERIATLPVPEDHERGSFLPEDHGASAASGVGRCATCHTQDRCVACHVDADNAAIASVPAAPQGMELPPAAAGYPLPDTHRAERFADAHAPRSGVGECSTCHTSNDCRSCHIDAAPTVVTSLPTRAETSAPGVGLARRAPASHESPFFQEAHGTLAGSDDATCATCHTDATCTDCHDGPAGGSYHPEGFVGGHSAAAFGRADECASCHETAVFCRSCHVESGLGSQGRPGSAYHDAEPVWLLRHGEAARQNLESCASCHQQRDCVQCHGVLGSFKVSPHQPGFDAAEAWARSPRTCLACHVGNPLSGGVR